MQSIAVGRHRLNTAVIGIAALALIGALVGGAAAILSTGDQSSISRPVASDTTTLVLDRDGADLFAPSGLRAVDTSRLNLDRDGADIVAPASRTMTVDTSGLSLDRDGADVFPEHMSAAPDVTTLRLDRDGADIP